MATPKKVKTLTINSTKYAIGGGESVAMEIYPDMYGSQYVGFTKGDQTSYQMTAAEFEDLAKNHSFIEVRFGMLGMRVTDECWLGTRANGIQSTVTTLNYIPGSPARIGIYLSLPFMLVNLGIDAGADPTVYSNWDVGYIGGYSPMNPVMFRLGDNTDLSTAGSKSVGFGTCVYNDPDYGPDPGIGNAMDAYALVAAAKSGVPVTICGKGITDAAGVTHDYINITPDSIEYNETAETFVIRFRSAGSDKTLTANMSGMPNGISSMTLA